MLKRVPQYIISVAIIGILAIPFLDSMLGLVGVSVHIKDGEKLIAVLLWLTLVGVVWYSEETQKLGKESVKQTDLNLAPYLTIGALPKKGEDNTPLYIRNMGRGIAVNATIKRESTKQLNWIVKYDFKSITNISAESTDGVRIPFEIIFEPSKKQIQDASASIPPANVDYTDPEHDYVLSLEYRDISGRVYKSEVRTDRRSNQRFKVIEYCSPSFQYRIM